MERNEILESIANGINAALKIQNLRNSALREDKNSMVRPSEFHMISEMLQILAEYSPKYYKDTIKNSIEVSNLYSNTYKALKHHLRSSRISKAHPAYLLKTLEIMQPVMPNQQKALIEKIQKIYEIINS